MEKILNLNLGQLDYIILFIGFATSLGSIFYTFFFNNPFKIFSWPTVMAKIVEVTIKEERFILQKQRSREYEIGYLPIVKFKYLYKGQEYTSESFSRFVTMTGKKKDAEDKLLKYPVGTRKGAYVNPSSPKEAYLERSKKDVFIFLLGMSIFMFIFPIVSTLIVIYRIR